MYSRVIKLTLFLVLIPAVFGTGFGYALVNYLEIPDVKQLEPRRRALDVEVQRQVLHELDVSRASRAERPQKGRLREFFQWNIDIIGEDSVLADAEVIFTTVDYLREIGLTPKDIKVKISSRKLLAAVLKKIGVPEEKLNPLYTLLDKKAKLPPEVFTATLTEQVGGDMAGRIIAFMQSQTVTSIENIVKAETGDQLEIAIKELEDCACWLNRMGISDYCVFDPDNLLRRA